MSEQADILVQFDERPNTRKVEKQAMMQRVLDAHRDAGPTWGYFLDGVYREIEHSCEACSIGLFRVEWPCRFVHAVKAAMGE